jgi:hypothetical protein
MQEEKKQKRKDFRARYVDRALKKPVAYNFFGLCQGNKSPLKE